MPNGNPEFSLEEQEEWFSCIAAPIERFVAEKGLVLDKYYHEAATWDLRFGHPSGGNASIEVANAGDMARLTTVWYLDDYDKFTRYLHWREPVEVELDAEAISNALFVELEAIVTTRPGEWTQTATGYQETWGKYSKAQFEAMGRTYPIPISSDETD